MAEAERLSLQARGMAFTAWAMGSGPLVLLLHGFPDTPHTFRMQLPALALNGYRAVAVTLRGYERSSQPADGSFYVDQLAADVVAWIDQLGAARAHVIGHDWGATIAFATAGLAPERVQSLTAIAVPHPRRFGEVLAADPGQLQRLDYIYFFQQVGAAEEAVAADDFRYLEELWRRWSPGWRFESNEFADVRRHFREPGVTQSALTYYRHAVDAVSTAGQAAQALFARPILAPTLGIHGVDDGCIAAAVFEKSMRDEDFPGGLHVAFVQNAGHFVHIEQAEAVNRLLVDHLAGAASKAG